MADNIFSVILEKVGNQPLKTTKVLCQALGLGLATAKAMVDKAPTTVATGIDRDKALALAKELEAIGNTVSIPGMKTESATPAKTQKGAEPKKTTTKESAPSPLNLATPSNDEFDTIFGGKKRLQLRQIARTMQNPRQRWQRKRFPQLLMMNLTLSSVKANNKN